MLTNTLKLSFRNLLRNRSYSLINIAGLAVGMSAAVLIFLWIQNEVQFDRFYRKSDRLFQVYNRDQFNGEASVWGSTPGPLGPELKREFADVEMISRYAPLTLLLSVSNNNSNVQGAFVDQDFIEMFDLSTETGSVTHALDQVHDIIITKKLAEKLFGSADAIGKTISIEHRDNFTVSAVLNEMPANSQFADREYFLPWDYFKSLGWASEEWTGNHYTTFVALRENASVAAVDQKIKKVTARHLEGVLDNTAHREIFLHPASRWHLYSKIENGELVDGGIVSVRIFGLIAAFILLIACVNFVNLSTARADKRAKEVGVRKVAGAPRRSLVFQFITESLLLTCISALLAFLIIFFALPAFNNLVGTQLQPDWSSVPFWGFAVGFVLITGLLAGTYPAFVLSGFKPAKVLKGTFVQSKSAFSLRKGLVVTQFTFAIVLIIATLVIRQQINHGLHRDAGYNRNNLLFTTLPGDLEKHYPALKQTLLDQGAAVSVTKSLGATANLNMRQWGVSWPGSTEADKNTEFDLFGADQGFVKTNGVILKEGREVNVLRFPSDSSAVVLNEAAVKAMRLASPIGTTITYQKKNWQVVGVVKDFIFDSPYSPVNPAIIAGPGGMFPYQWLSIRLNPQNTVAKNLQMLEATFKKMNPAFPFEYGFADDTYKARFAREQLVGSLTGIFTGLAIFISCLGLFGLAAYSARQRTKEIGVRKVLGSSVAGIVALLTGDFVKLVVIAFIIAAPVGWYAMNAWLQDFDYRTVISPTIFIVTAISTLLIVLFTVSFQAIKAALINPVKSLRSD